MMWDFKKNLLITSDNQKERVHYINLLKLIPKIKQTKKFKYKQPIFKTRNFKLFDINITPKHNENEENKPNDKVTIINMEQLYKSSTTKSVGTQMTNNTSNINSIKTTNFKNTEKLNSDENDKNIYSDRIFAFFNRNFYECELPTSKKIELNQNILNYYIQEKEQKEKFRRLKYEELMSRKNKFFSKKNFKPVLEKKYDIKKSLRLNDFRIYNKIHKVMRFWGKLANYACPIFQVQKFSLSSQKYKENKIKFSLENLNKSDLAEKNIKLPVLYTNSSNTINRLNERKRYIFAKSKSNLNLSDGNSYNINNL